ncbi:MAG: acyl-CoA dehydrogenase family protein [Byssovorax sp.]
MDDDVRRARIDAVKLLDFLLAADPAVVEVASMSAWWERHQAIVARGGATIDHAILGGFAADRLGYAFASGYQAALRQLAPDLPADRLASLCVTERGGGHPRAIESQLTPVTPDGEELLLRGSKRWATISDVAGVLLVAATLGAPDDRGRPRIRVVRVEADLPGVAIAPMPPTPFTPEILHGELRFDDVRVEASALLPGDGYERYIKPFRTLEDLHVNGALFGYLLGEARRGGSPRALLERLAALLTTLRALAASDPSDAGVHVALAGALHTAGPLVTDLEASWALAAGPSYALWQRDRLLLGIAESARARRLERAWSRLAEGSEAADVES